MLHFAHVFPPQKNKTFAKHIFRITTRASNSLDLDQVARSGSTLFKKVNPLMTQTEHFYSCGICLGHYARKSVFGGFRQQRTDQAARILISAFVIQLLESITSRLATSEISIF